MGVQAARLERKRQVAQLRIVMDRAHELRRCRAIVKGHFVSATDDPQVIQAAMEAGGLAYVMNPPAGRELIPAIRRALQGL